MVHVNIETVVQGTYILLTQYKQRSMVENMFFRNRVVLDPDSSTQTEKSISKRWDTIWVDIFCLKRPLFRHFLE